MAKGEEKVKPQDKGKGKAEEKAVNGVNGAKEAGEDGPKDGDLKLPAEELSEEDQKSKDELDMLVERLLEKDKSLYKAALEAINTNIKTSTSSMTAIPKPLKFLRPHYEKLRETYDTWPAGDDKNSLADTLSVLGMTYSDSEDRRDTLKYRLLAPSSDLGSWGHEYMRHLALEIGQEYQARLDEEKATEDIAEMTRTLVPFFLSHNAEADAVDILSELEMIEEIKKYVDADTYARVCLYMVSMVPLLTYPDNDRFVRTAHDIYVTHKQLAKAISLAIRLNDMDLIKADFASTDDKALKRQLALIIGRQRLVIDLEGEDAQDVELQECMNNAKLPEYFKTLAKELNVLDPKVPEDIYKSHLESSRTAGLTNTDSARHNLASAFVNGFVNAGFGDDKLMQVEGGVKNSWIWKVKEEGMISTAASAGLLNLWDVEMSLDKIDAYTYVPEEQVKAGAALAMGIMNSGVRLESDPTMALLGDFEGKSVTVRVASIMGLGLAYAGSNREDLLEILLPLVAEPSLDMQISAMAALSLGMIFVGSAQSDVSEAIIQTLLDEDRTNQLKDKWTRFMTLGLALLYLGQQEEVDVVLETLKAIDHPMSKPASVLADICAWSGTGAVLKLQQLLHICNEHIEDKDESKDSDKDKDKDKKEDGAEEEERDIPGAQLVQSYAVLGLSLVALGEDVGQEMVLRQFGHLMHYSEPNIRRAVPLAMGLISVSNPQMKIYDTLSRYSHDNDVEVAINAIFAMGLVGAGTNNARLAQLLRQLASYYSRDGGALFMVRIAQGLLHAGKGTMTLSPLHTDRSVLSRVAASGLLTVAISLISNPKDFILDKDHYLLYYLVTAMHPRFLITLGEDLKPLQVNVRVGQAVDVVGQAGRPKTITGWQTQSTPVLLGHGERAELEDEEWICLASVMEGVCILKKNPDWQAP
ncbi:proteasome regulatory particle base subunit [Meristemomyces frigidus]|uniref:26S proteasome regulatory subunit RPN1 n=1 Tax=Meristemomyces frigidus TaxID=1508187 RepID=A0AAN7YS29_9PEZI|nr:proteasome regulatory particle base subunit [Meristemomyces frigidus]